MSGWRIGSLTPASKRASRLKGRPRATSTIAASLIGSAVAIKNGLMAIGLIRTVNAQHLRNRRHQRLPSPSAGFPLKSTIAVSSIGNAILTRTGQMAIGPSRTISAARLGNRRRLRLPSPPAGVSSAMQYRSGMGKWIPWRAKTTNVLRPTQSQTPPSTQAVNVDLSQVDNCCEINWQCQTATRIGRMGYAGIPDHIYHCSTDIPGLISIVRRPNTFVDLFTSQRR